VLSSQSAIIQALSRGMKTEFVPDGAKNGVAIYLNAIEYLGKNEALQDDIQTKVANILSPNIVDKLEEASKERAVWIREDVKDIIKKVF